MPQSHPRLRAHPPRLHRALLCALALPLCPTFARAAQQPEPEGAPAAAAQSQSYDGRWQGVIVAAPGVNIEFIVTLSTDAATGAQSATIDIPIQAIAAAPLTRVSFSADAVRFALQHADAEWTATWKKGGDGEGGPLAEGELTQGQGAFPFQLKRLGARALPGDIAPLPPGAERWRGFVQLPTGPLEFFVTFTPPDADDENGAHTATIDIAGQDVVAAPLTAVTFTPREIRFTLQAPGAPRAAVFTLARPEADPTRAAGHVLQDDKRSAAFLELLEGEPPDPNAPPPRPQRPSPPFPYAQRDVSYTSPGAATDPSAEPVRIAGTLTIPEGPGPHPAALLITGSGPQDRDETIADHRPFLVIADHLTRRGIAVLRVDDRGVGASTGDSFAATTQDLAADVRAGLAFLRAQPEIDAARVGLIGHSEGAAVGALVAADNPDVAFLVLLAGTGVPGADVWLSQTAHLLRAAGATKPLIDRQLAAQRALLGALAADAPADELRARIHDFAAAQSGVAPPPPERLATVVDALTPALTSPWFRSFMEHDPRESLRAVRAPVLALAGELDLQVPPRENLPEIEKALRAGGNQSVSAVELPGLNHLFQSAATGQVSEYQKLTETFAPEALELLTMWICEKTARPLE